MIRTPALALCLALVAGPLAAQTDDPVLDGLAQAQAYRETGQLEAAVETYRAITRAAPAEARAWFGLASAQLERGRDGDRVALAEALQALDQADRLGVAPAVVRFNQACAHAGLGERDAALERLTEAVAAGYLNLAAFDGDPDLAPLRAEPRFLALREEVARKARPCEHDARYRQLDFWLGAWEVVNGQGRVVGHNRIERAERGCLVTESWRSVAGGTGRSVNYYDPGDGRWRQDWIDGGGQVIHYEGEFVDGAMRLAGTLTGPDGARQPSRMTLTPRPDGHVIQHIEVSADAGASWRVWFHGEYRPDPAGAGAR